VIGVAVLDDCEMVEDAVDGEVDVAEKEGVEGTAGDYAAG
jgi:hypothetical protein